MRLISSSFMVSLSKDAFDIRYVEVSCDCGSTGLGASDYKTEVSGRHIPTDSGINETVQQRIAVERFDVLDFHRCLATARLRSDVPSPCKPGNQFPSLNRYGPRRFLGREGHPRSVQGRAPSSSMCHCMHEV